MSKKKIAVTNNFPLTNPVKTPITNVLYVVDRSGSMESYWEEVKRQLKSTLEHLRDEACDKRQEVRVSLVSFNSSAVLHFSDVHIRDLDITNRINALGNPAGRTQLWGAVDYGFREMSSRASLRNSFAENAFLVNILTDGENNEYPNRFQNATEAAADNCTFTAACPPGHAVSFRNSGFDTENVIEWSGSEAVPVEYGEKTKAGLTTYITSRAAGLTKSSAFYVDASKVDVTKLTELSPRPVEVKTKTTVREFAEEKTKRPYELGSLSLPPGEA
jgi:hypothetical protein